MENMPILYKNVMDGLPSQIARDAFLWATEQPENDRMCYNAERFAREVDRLIKTLGPWINKAFERHAKSSGQSCVDASEDVRQDLMDYILTRHANWRYGGNKKLSYTTKEATK